MIDALHDLVDRFGLAAVFLGCIAEGESAAILGGFFAHQGLFAIWQVITAAFAGSFLGDGLFFLAGKYLSDSAFVYGMRQKPAFGYACRMVEAYPGPYVLLNRYVYGFRILGGVVAGLSGISMPKFVVLNALASLIWAILFVGLGYACGLGAEQLIGAELAKHERLLAGLVLGVVALVAGWHVTRRIHGRIRVREAAPGL
jgi:membrane protein DedA with SNARE-associated domain